MSTYIDSLLIYLEQYKGQETTELFRQVNMNSTAKNKNNMLAWKLIEKLEGRKIAQAKIEHANINIKTIQLKENGNPQEGMSFSTIDYEKIVNEEWDESKFKKYLLLFLYSKKISSWQSYHSPAMHFSSSFIKNLP